nr:MAG TPA: hypothetical protein [Caudoviricetes sp.]
MGTASTRFQTRQMPAASCRRMHYIYYLLSLFPSFFLLLLSFVCR